MDPIKPGQQTPNLSIETLSHGVWELGKQRPKRFTMVVFYRGYHCSTCMEYIHDLASRLDQFNKLGVEVFAVSCDGHERAQQTKDEWHLGKLPLGYGLTVPQARQWGLYLSKAVLAHESDVFCEPGMFVVHKNGTLYSAQVQSHPFARPDLAQTLKDFEYIIERNYPARGGY